MSKGLIAAIVAGLLLLVSSCSVLGYQSDLATKDEAVGMSYGKIQTALQRRSDLIGQLVPVVKGAAKFEKSTFVDIAKARASAGGAIHLDPSKVANDPALQKQLYDAQSTLSGALSRLMVVSERYPQLQATQSFRDLQSQVEGSENRIKVARDNNQQAVNDYNRAVRIGIESLAAKLWGYEPKPYYVASEGAQSAPKINFDN